MKEIIKKNWFVGLIAFFLIIAIIIFAADATKTNVKAKKTEDGKDVVFSYDGKDYTADDMYDEVYKTLDIGVIIPVLEIEVYRDSLELTPAIKNDAQANANNIVTSLKQEYGEQWEFALNRLLVQSGYLTNTGTKGLEEYLTILEMRSQIEREYVKTHPEVIEGFMKEHEPRMISHILVKMADPDKPTKEESGKLEEAKKALSKENADFAEVAREFSDDTSAQNGGSLGLVTKTSIQQFVPEFKDQVYKVGVNEKTEWFKTEFGYHIISVDAVDLEGFEKLNNYDVYKQLFDANPSILLDITWDQIQKQGISFGDNQELADAITKHYAAKEEK